ALEKGFTPATVLNDAPFVIDPAKTGGQLWEPHNYDNKYEGPMRLRTALMKSKNMVSIRLLQAIGPAYAQDYIQRFGFDPRMHPAYLTMALGAGSVTPLQMAGAYSIFANGGYRVKPWFIARVEDDGRRRRRARDRRAQRLHHDDSHARRRAARHRGARDGARARRPRRQDGHHERPRRRLVLRLPEPPGGDRVDRLRYAREPGRERDREPGGAPDLDGVRGQGPERRAGDGPASAARRRRREHRSGDGPARARRPQPRRRLVLPGIAAAARGFRNARPRRAPAGGSEEPDLLTPWPRHARDATPTSAGRSRRSPRGSWRSTAWRTMRPPRRRRRARRGSRMRTSFRTTRRSKPPCANTRASTRARTSRRTCAACGKSP